MFYQTFLHYACKLGNLELVKDFIENYDFDKSLKTILIFLLENEI